MEKAVKRLATVGIHLVRNPVAAASVTCSSSLRCLCSAPSQNDEVLFEECDSKRIITLNRPTAHNALNHSMVHSILEKMQDYAKDNSIDLLIMRGAGDKAFCAGGDVRELAATAAKDPKSPDAFGFLRTEYAVMYAIGTCKVPFVALTDGFCMGAGCGLSVNGKFRVASENTVMSMPETAIGYYPDNGASYFLSHLSSNLGLYFGLTCARVHGEDTINSGLATHYVTQHNGMYAKLLEDLCAMKNPTHDSVKTLLDDYHKACYTGANSEFKSHVTDIERSFSLNTVEDILHSLSKEGTTWAKSVYDAIITKSPTALKFTMRQLRQAQKLNFLECMTMELRMGRWILCQANSDFQRGVRAVLVDKHNKPQWCPANIADITETDIDQYFKPIESGIPEFCPSGRS